MLACGGPAAHDARTAPPTFEIRLHRPSHVGERWHIVADGTQSESKSTYTEQVVVKKSEKHQAIHFDATVTALAVEGGVVSRAEYLVTAFESVKNHEQLLAPGKHVVIQPAPKKDDTVIAVDGQPATPDVREALGIVMALTREPGDDDTVFGTHERQPIGASWAVNGAAMRTVLVRNGASAPSDAIHGQVTLASRTPDDCLDVRVDLHVDSFTPLAPLPEGSQITKSKVLLQAKFALPIDTRLSLRRAELDVHTEFEAFVPVQSAEIAGVTVDSQTDHHRSTAYTPLAP
jgi:hypothetical protein